MRGFRRERNRMKSEIQKLLGRQDVKKNIYIKKKLTESTEKLKKEEKIGDEVQRGHENEENELT